jgi:hypothetical protein
MFIVLILKSIPIRWEWTQNDGITYCGHMSDREIIFWESEKDACFANWGIANDDEFNEVIIARFLKGGTHNY